MAFNKIQPQQIQLPTFFSNSGNILFTDLSTGIQAELGTGIYGKVNFLSGILSQGKEVVKQTATTIQLDNNNVAIGTSGTLQVTGYNNLVLGGEINDLGGSFNAVLNSVDVTVGTNTSKNTVIGGGAIVIDNSVTGSIALASSNSSFSIDQSQTIFLGANSGVKVLSDTEFDTLVDVTINHNLFVENTGYLNYLNLDNDLVVSGNARISGSIFSNALTVTGVSNFSGLYATNFINFKYITGVSGDFASGLLLTGSKVATESWTSGNFISTGVGVTKYFLTGGQASQWLVTGDYAGASDTGTIILKIAGNEFKITGEWIY